VTKRVRELVHVLLGAVPEADDKVPFRLVQNRLLH
jgi:hypothetical protein